MNTSGNSTFDIIEIKIGNFWHGYEYSLTCRRMYSAAPR